MRFIPIFLLLLGSLFSDGESSTPPLPPPPVAPLVEPLTPPPFEGYELSFTRMFLTLIALLAALFFAVYILKKMIRGRNHSLNAGYAIKILEKRALSPKTVLYLIEVEGQQTLIAESQLEVKRLLEVAALTEDSE